VVLFTSSEAGTCGVLCGGIFRATKFRTVLLRAGCPSQLTTFQAAEARKMASANYPLILTEGGDDRLVLNAKGVNKYHCRPEVS